VKAVGAVVIVVALVVAAFAGFDSPAVWALLAFGVVLTLVDAFRAAG
jgi:hypothetical protein